MSKKPTADQLYAFEANFETAIAGILKAGGLDVVSPFVRTDSSGRPIETDPLPDEYCIVEFNVGDTDPAVMAQITDTSGAIVDAIEAGWQGEIVVTHSVRMDDTPPPAGEPLGCYSRLCRQRGRIRALLLDPQRPLRSLSWYSILSLRLTQPERRVDAPRQANLAVERFRVRFMPARGMV